MIQKIVPVILCGGSGTRLRPLSSDEKPKQFLRLIDEHSLLQNTAIRAMNVADVTANEIVTVTLNNMQSKIIDDYNEIDAGLCGHILSEPSAKNTAAAVALAALYVKKKFGENAIMWVVPADHHIADESALKTSLECAVNAALSGYLATFGIEPSRAETGYGYIKVKQGHSELEGVSLIERFVEKPDLDNAIRFLEEGDYLWNSGMFVFKVQTVLDAYKEHSHKILEQTDKSLSYFKAATTVDADLYDDVEKQPFDIAIMEKAKNIAVISSNPQWSDIGSWQSLYELKTKEGFLKLIENFSEEEQSKIFNSINQKMDQAA